MQVDTGAFQALTERVEQLAAKLELYHRQAAMVAAIEDVIDGPPPAWPPERRPRHLRAIDGGAP